MLQLITRQGYWLIDQATGAITPLLLPDSATVINVDDQNTIWYIEAGDDHLYAWDGHNTPQTFGVEQGWTPVTEPGTLIGQPIIATGATELWLATGQDVRRFDGQTWTVFSRELMLMAPSDNEDFGQVFALAYSPLTKTVWVGECDWGGPGPVGGGGVRWFDGTLWHGADSPVATGCATGSAEANNGHIWIALDANLWRFDPADSSWLAFTPPTPDDIPRPGYVRELVLDHRGHPWTLFSLCGGASCDNGFMLYRLANEQWTPAAAPSFDIPRFLFSQTGELYLFSDGQLLSGNPDNGLEPVADFALMVAAATVDPQNTLWLIARPDPDQPWALWYQPSLGGN